jgi:hypothetical protein
LDIFSRIHYSKDDLYLLDRTIDEHVGEAVSVEIYRNGQSKTAIATVEDLAATKD